MHIFILLIIIAFLGYYIYSSFKNNEFKIKPTYSNKYIIINKNNKPFFYWLFFIAEIILLIFLCFGLFCEIIERNPFEYLTEILNL